MCVTIPGRVLCFNRVPKDVLPKEKNKMQNCRVTIFVIEHDLRSSVMLYFKKTKMY